ncbi:MAG: hypothetical protein ACI35P_07185 [Bacillus sp. (in: firmicutes)]
MKKRIHMYVAVAMLLVLSGCLYPQSEKTENQMSTEQQVASVQVAVDQYREGNDGLLPIKNQDATVPYYQKYPIDFKKLERYMPEPPGNAYENGGVFQYVLIDVEEHPTVKIFDLRMASIIQDYQLRLSFYRQDNEFFPFKEQLDTYVFTLDYKKLGYKDNPVVTSPFSQKDLSMVVDSEGQIFIDYTPDLAQALMEKEHTFTQGEDIRSILTDNTVFVPAFSLPYTVNESNQPVFMTN